MRAAAANCNLSTYSHAMETSCCRLETIFPSLSIYEYMCPSSPCIWRKDWNLEENWEGGVGAEVAPFSHPKWNMIGQLLSRWGAPNGGNPDRNIKMQRWRNIYCGLACQTRE